jgi:hypothetical protein
MTPYIIRFQPDFLTSTVRSLLSDESAVVKDTTGYKLTDIVSIMGEVEQRSWYHIARAGLRV